MTVSVFVSVSSFFPSLSRFSRLIWESTYLPSPAVIARSNSPTMLEAADLAVEAIQELLETINVSYKISDYGIPEEDLSKLVEGAMKQSRLFVPNPRDPNEEDVRMIYRMAY